MQRPPTEKEKLTAAKFANTGKNYKSIAAVYDNILKEPQAEYSRLSDLAERQCRNLFHLMQLHKLENFGHLVALSKINGFDLPPAVFIAMRTSICYKGKYYSFAIDTARRIAGTFGVTLDDFVNKDLYLQQDFM